MRALVRLRRLAATISRGEWRDALIRLDRRWRAGWFDFGKSAPEEYGLDAGLSRAHQASSADLEAVLATLEIRHSDSILDVGCGKGRALVSMCKHPFRLVAGVELSPELAGIAQRNLKRLLLTRRTRVVCGDAGSYENLDEFTFLYCFNPFGPAVMRRFLARVAESFERSPRKIVIIYNNPVEEGEILSTGRFDKVRSFCSQGKAPVTVYESRIGEISAYEASEPYLQMAGLQCCR